MTKLATIASTGSYTDLKNQPTILAAQVQSNWAETTTSAANYIQNKPVLATVATLGAYSSLTGLPPLTYPFGWIAATLPSGITNVSAATPAAYAISVTDGIWVRGVVTGAATGSTITTLPTGYRPKYNMSFTGWGVGTSNLGATTMSPVQITINASTGAVVSAYAANTFATSLDIG